MNGPRPTRDYDGQWLWLLVIVVLIFWKDLWYSKWRIAVYYEVANSRVEVDQRPHDCEFLTSPLGEKHCSYQSEVVMNAMGPKSQGSHRTIYYSDNGGKTWQTWGNPDVRLPDGSTLVSLSLHWVKQTN